MPTRRPSLLLAVAALAGAVGGVAVSWIAGGLAASPPEPAGAVGWRSIGAGPPRPTLPARRAIVLLRAPSLAERVEAAGGLASDGEERRWTQAALAAQDRLLRRLAAAGVSLAVEHRFARVVNGFSAPLDSGMAALLERMPGVAGVYPARAAYPASLASALPVSPPPVGLSAFSGRGVTIALLDTGVDWRSSSLQGRVLPGIDVVDGAVDASPRLRPGSPGSVERHGTAMAGVLVGRAGLGRPPGLVPEATVLPIRVAGWQRDAVGRWSLHARTDQIVAGLERAVDPNRNGDAHDAVRIALVGVAEPMASFADGPLARAAAGAAALDTLVVAPAGNGGEGGPMLGRIAGPAGAEAALAVGAADLRPRVADVAVLVRSGARVLLRRRLPLLAAAVPPPATLELVAAPGRAPRDLFAPSGLSRVAGRAVLLPAGGGIREAAVALARAGAALVVAAGSALPAGALGLGVEGTPVVAGPAALAGELRRARRAGRPVLISVGAVRQVSNPGLGRAAPFSARGPGLAGQPKPDLVAPGVALATVEPAGGRRSRPATVSGASAAAAVAAGAAARLLQARPELDAGALRGALVGTARPLPGEADSAQGSGLLDASRAVAAEVVAEPAALALGRVPGAGRRARRLLLRNLSSRPLTVTVVPGRRPPPGLEVKVEPGRAALDPGATAAVTVSLRASSPPAAGVAWGTLAVRPSAGPALRVPWTVVLGPPRGLLGRVRLSPRRLEASAEAPAVLSVAVSGEALARLDVELLGPGGRPLGVYARLRHLLPGRHALGLTPVGPGGRPLPPGPYLLRLTAVPAAGGRAVTRSLPFRVE